MIAVNKYVNRQHLLQYSLDEQLIHGMRVSNLAYQVAKELGEPEEFCHCRGTNGPTSECVTSEISY